ncbi:anaphase-promoting complex subunit cdc27 [Mortierella alpina]|uniref:Anaphase-promoting complex subunit cdc27 n=1 Tax=Mortierella alpina TaxID=64518 RepID=A0A9P6J3N8_MORAP|nr:anaphase-promoting complex subunit cdc27 [Mortierella alpina]
MAVKAASAAFSAEATTSAASPWGLSATKPDPVCQRLEHLIKYSLDRFQFRNAVFLAERLRSLTLAPGHSAAEQEYAQYLLAVCHYRQGSLEMAWATLEDCSSPRSQFLFAQCCLELRRYIECNGALERLLELQHLRKCSATAVPGMASLTEQVYSTYSVIPLAQKRHQLAIKYFKEALELNPFLWEAFENLCELGAPQDPEKMFAQFDVKTGSILPKSIALLQRSRTVGVDGSGVQGGRATATQDENIESASMDTAYNQVNVPSKFDTTELTRPKSTFLPPIPPSISALVQMNGSSILESDNYGLEAPTAPSAFSNHDPPSLHSSSTMDTTERVPLRRGTATQQRRQFERTKSTTSIHGHVFPGGATKRALERSATVSSFATSGPLRGLKSRNNMKNNPLVSKKDFLLEDREDQKETVVSPALTEAELEAEEEGLRMVADIIRIMARAYGLLALNKFTESLAEFLSLPSEHLLSGWVQCQIAKTRFGMEEYASAAQYFKRARELEPSLHRDMEMYSTCLWHLRDDMALSTLAKELKDSNRLSPQAWCALGNAYSRRHENDQALKCFQRAIQLHDRFAYAHTLSGHEYADLEEYDKAQTEYRAAMSIDPRHYYAWYGMGMIFDKMGKNDLALIHYKEAQKLNPSSGVLLYRVGTIQEKMNRITEALRSFEEALNLDPNNVAARYHKAKVQADLEQFEESLKELEVVKKHRHNEPNVFMLQGKILMKMGKKELALKYLTWALDLDSKSSHAIRDLIEKVDQDANVEEESYEVKVDMDD